MQEFAPNQVSTSIYAMNKSWNQTWTSLSVVGPYELQNATNPADFCYFMSRREWKRRRLATLRLKRRVLTVQLNVDVRINTDSPYVLTFSPECGRWLLSECDEIVRPHRIPGHTSRAARVPILARLPQVHEVARDQHQLNAAIQRCETVRDGTWWICRRLSHRYDGRKRIQIRDYRLRVSRKSVRRASCIPCVRHSQ